MEDIDNKFTSHLLRLPDEIQTLIYQHYYPPWTLHAPCEDLDEIEGYVLSESNGWLQCDTPQKFPSINLLLTCRDTNYLAAPILQASFTGVFNISLAHSTLNEPLCKQYALLLARTESIHLDMHYLPTRIENGFARYEEYLPRLLSVMFLDCFKCVNTRSHLIKNDIVPAGASDADVEFVVNSTPALKFAEEIVRQRSDSTQYYWILAGLTRERSNQISSITYLCRFMLDGVQGVFEVQYEMTESQVNPLTMRKIDNPDLLWWPREMETLDLEEERRNNCVLM